MPPVPGGALALLSAPKTLSPQRQDCRATEQPSSAQPPLLQPHLVLISSLTRGWLSRSAGSCLSPLECARIFRKRVVSDVHPGREKDCPRFPTLPPPFSGFDGKAISEEVPPTRAFKAHKPTGKQRSHIIPMLIAAGTAVLPLGETQVAQTPKSSSNLLNLCIFCIPTGKISCPPNIGHKI